MADKSNGKRDDGSAARMVGQNAAEAERRKRMRSIAIALALGALVVMFYVATLARLGGNALNRPM